MVAMKNATKSERWKVGNFIAIAAKDGGYYYGRIRPHGIVAFYDVRTDNLIFPGERSLRDFLKISIAFSVCVMTHALKSERWKIIGWEPLEPRFLNPLKFFIQDRASGKFRIYSEDGTMLPANRSEIEGLESAAVWDPEHVEDRLRDHFSGVRNTWVESLKPK